MSDDPPPWKDSCYRLIPTDAIDDFELQRIAHLIERKAGRQLHLLDVSRQQTK
jgi:hypothetical protein